MKVFVAGIDGYLGWSLTQHLTERGHEVAGADFLLRRSWVEEMGSQSAIPVLSPDDRKQAFKERWGRDLDYVSADFRDPATVRRLFASFKPDAVVHLAECPSAPYSMIDVDHAIFVQTNNLATTFSILYALKEEAPEAQLIKLGTMGEYGTPPVDIPEGFFEIEFRGRRARLSFPRAAGSWYHQSKVHGSHNIAMACSVWGLRATDIMQGIVYGVRIPAMGASDARLLTRLDFDQAFGTSINRFVCQAIAGEPISVYGAGGQTRGFIPLRDSMECLTLTLENPPKRGEYRVFNQFASVFRVSELAEIVAREAAWFGFDPKVLRIENPRMELESHYYNPDHENLMKLGYKPSSNHAELIRELISDLAPYKERVLEKRAALMPDVRWRGGRETCRPLQGS